MTSSAYFLT